MNKFRFENLDIWKDGMCVCSKLIDIASCLENKRLFSFADQLRRAALSITNNISEGAGSYSKKEFAYFLSVSRRSLFECVNIILVFRNKDLIAVKEAEEIYQSLYSLSVKIHNFRLSVLKSGE
ncbi:MAG: four helix bundle protein [Bacteroidetes bacterium]|jgi:four helix bundle protein|nr:four helix bundle protein [Bacteroidota bacterium]